MSCPICQQRPAEIGVLCEECRDDLSSSAQITPEQIQLHGDRPTAAALVDLWGRLHALETRTLVGRQIEGLGLAVLEPSVSRHHAHLTLEADGTAWTLRDLGSANGTWLDDKLVETPTRTKTGDRIRFGHIGFYMIEDASRLSSRGGRAVQATLRPFDVTEARGFASPADQSRSEGNPRTTAAEIPSRSTVRSTDIVHVTPVTLPIVEPSTCERTYPR